MSIADKLITIADNTPAVAEAVHESRINLTVVDSAVRVDDVYNDGHNLKCYTAGGATVDVYGKNLFKVQDFIDYANSVSKGNLNDTYLDEPCFSFSNYRNADGSVVMPFDGKPNTRYTLSCECSFSYQKHETYTNMAVCYVRYSDNTSESVAKTMPSNSFTPVTFTTNANKTVVGIGISRFAANCTIYIKNMQIEVGTVATEYEEYKDRQRMVSTGGRIYGLMTKSPTMTIVVSGDCQAGYFSKDNETYAKYKQLKAAQVALAESIKEG